MESNVMGRPCSESLKIVAVEHGVGTDIETLASRLEADRIAAKREFAGFLGAQGQVGGRLQGTNPQVGLEDAQRVGCNPFGLVLQNRFHQRLVYVRYDSLFRAGETRIAQKKRGQQEGEKHHNGHYRFHKCMYLNMCSTIHGCRLSIGHQEIDDTFLYLDGVTPHV